VSGNLVLSPPLPSKEFCVSVILKNAEVKLNGETIMNGEYRSVSRALIHAKAEGYQNYMESMPVLKDVNHSIDMIQRRNSECQCNTQHHCWEG